MRQDHAAPDHRRADPARFGRSALRRCRRRRHGARGPAHRHGVSRLRALPALHVPEERPVVLPVPEEDAGAGRAGPGQVPADQRAHGSGARLPARSQADDAVGRREAAGGAGPLHHPRRRSLPRRRAVRQSRPGAAREIPRQPQDPAAPVQHHHGLRDPRSPRGADPGRPGGGDGSRPDRAGRHTAGHLRRAQERLRGRLPEREHRHAAAQPHRRVASCPSTGTRRASWPACVRKTWRSLHSSQRRACGAPWPARSAFLCATRSCSPFVGESRRSTPRSRAARTLRPGDDVGLRFKQYHLFDKASGARLRSYQRPLQG